MKTNPNCSGDLRYITPQPTHLSSFELAEALLQTRKLLTPNNSLVPKSRRNSVTWKAKQSMRAPGLAPLSRLALPSSPPLCFSFHSAPSNSSRKFVLLSSLQTQFSAILKSNYYLQLVACYNTLENIKTRILALYCLQ